MNFPGSKALSLPSHHLIIEFKLFQKYIEDWSWICSLDIQSFGYGGHNPWNLFKKNALLFKKEGNFALIICSYINIKACVLYYLDLFFSKPIRDFILTQVDCHLVSNYKWES